MEDDVVISVIIPVYNTEKYVRQCICSILNQTYSEFELILVDDGSTDKSGAICDEYARSDPRVKTVHINNCGPFQARAVGARLARGKYLTFADSDDWLEVHAFEKIVYVCSNDEPDIIAYAYEEENGQVINSIYNEKLYSKFEIQNEVIGGMMFEPRYGRGRLSPSLCCKFIKSGLFLLIANQIEERITLGDDALIVYPAVCHADSIYITNQTLYHYRINEKSCTHSFPISRVLEVEAFQRNINKLFLAMGYYSIMQFQVELYIRVLLQLMIKNWYGIDILSIRFVFPYKLVPYDSKLVIYGAGTVGKSYINEIKNSQYADIVGWVDTNYEKIRNYNRVDICSPEKISNITYDFVIVAVLDSHAAEEIITFLLEYGVSAEKIIWTTPIRCF